MEKSSWVALSMLARPVPGPTAEDPEDKVGIRGDQEDMAAVGIVIRRKTGLSAPLMRKALFADF